MRRHALFVGVNTYDDKSIRKLRYSIPDASVLADRFKGFGYTTRLLADPTAAELKAAVVETVEGLGHGDVFLFFFAGHGFTAQDGAHLLFCRDDRQRLLRVNAAGVRVDALEALTDGGGFHRAFLLDSCRTDCFAGMEGRGNGITRDLDFVTMPECTEESGSYFLLRSCDKFRPSLELDGIGHGLFTQALLDAMDARDGRLAICDTSFAEAIRVKMADIQRTYNVIDPQRPSLGDCSGPHFSIFEKGVLTPAESAGAQNTHLVICPACGSRNREEQTFRCRVCGRDYLCAEHLDKKERCCEDCAATKRTERAEREAIAEQKARDESLRNGTCLETGICRTIILPGGVKMEMIYCPPGVFMMGSPTTEEGRENNETQHRVRLTKGFWLGKYPTTQAHWKSVMGTNPSTFKGEDLPVANVSWDDCQSFINKVNVALGCGLRLPTEAEWEYGCRAGTTTAYFWGNALNGDKANCDGNYPCGTTRKGPYLAKVTPVGRYDPNPWGFYDMHGNVWEWCNDRWGTYPSGSVTNPTGPVTGLKRVARGCSWFDRAGVGRSAHRYGCDPGARGFFGFRLCCDDITAVRNNSSIEYGLYKGLNFYYGQHGAVKNYAEAIKYFRDAANNGNANAQYHLGRMYVNGCGVEKDEMEAAKWFRKAAEQGDESAQCYIGWMYGAGRGVAKDEVEAVKWYRKAAERGHAHSQYNLGWMYENGRGVTKDNAEAVKWYRKSADQGDKDATKALERFR